MILLKKESFIVENEKFVFENFKSLSSEIFTKNLVLFVSIPVILIIISSIIIFLNNSSNKSSGEVTLIATFPVSPLYCRLSSLISNNFGYNSNIPSSIFILLENNGVFDKVIVRDAGDELSILIKSLLLVVVIFLT